MEEITVQKGIQQEVANSLTQKQIKKLRSGKGNKQWCIKGSKDSLGNTDEK